MKFMQKYSRRLNLNICPEIYDIIKQEASIQGRKVGNMARQILDEWARDKEFDYWKKKDKLL